MYCPNNQLCSEFQRLAEWTMRRINEADNYGLYFNEETITDSILLKLRKRAPHNLLIKAYTKYEEGKGPHKTGADWEFRFSSNVKKSKDIILRVQAKKMKKTERRREPRYHIDTKQLAAFEIDAARHGAEPVYVFYNWLPLSSSNTIQSGCKTFPSCIEGCTYLTADKVVKLPKANNKSQMTVDPSDFGALNPWHILVCPCHLPNHKKGRQRKTLHQIVSQNLNLEANASRPRPFVPQERLARIDTDNVVAIKRYLKKNRLAGILHFSELREMDDDSE